MITKKFVTPDMQRVFRVTARSEKSARGRVGRLPLMLSDCEDKLAQMPPQLRQKLSRRW